MTYDVRDTDPSIASDGSQDESVSTASRLVLIRDRLLQAVRDRSWSDLDEVAARLDELARPLHETVEARPGLARVRREPPEVVREPASPIVPVLLVSSRGTPLAIPRSDLTEIVRLRADERLEVVDGVDVLRHRDRVIPLHRLATVSGHTASELVSHRAEASGSRPQPVTIVVLATGPRQFGLVVDEVLDFADLVVGPADRRVRAEPWSSGVAALGDGRAAHLLDVKALAALIPGASVEECPREASPERFVEPDEVAPEERTRILVAEDNTFYRNQLQGYLAACGYAVVACHDGDSAWDTLRRDRGFAAVVTDTEMPHMTGLELTRRIKADPSLAAVPVVIVSSLQDEEGVRRGYASGANDYQSKGDRQRLQGSLARLIGEQTGPATEVRMNESDGAAVMGIESPAEESHA